MKKISLIVLLAILSSAMQAQTAWVRHPDNPVLKGDAGEWDENLDYIGSVIFFDNQYHMWYSASKSGNHKIGYATSRDGITWTKDPGNPVFERGETRSWDQDYGDGAAVIGNG